MLRWRGREQVGLDVSARMRRDYSDRKWEGSHQRLGTASCSYQTLVTGCLHVL